MLYADHDRDMEKGSTMNGVDSLKEMIKNSVKSVDEIVNFDEFSHLFKSERPFVWFQPFGEEGGFMYTIWEGTKDGGSNQLLCNIDEVGRITNSKYLGVVYPDDEY